MQWQSAMVAQWPTVFVTLEQLEHATARLMPVSGPPSNRCEPSADETLWVAEVQGSIVGIAWGWAAASCDAVAMTDPMTVATNLVLTDCDGRLLDDDATILRLNNMIYELPWQRQVRSWSEPSPEFGASRRVSASRKKKEGFSVPQIG